MARARNIKPSFFKNEDLSELDPYARLLFIGLWCLADREGRLEDRPKRIKAELFPYDDCDVDDLLQQLHNMGFILRYEVDNGKYIFIVKWHKHQNPHHMEVPSVIPPAPGTTNKFAHSPVTKEQRKRIMERDGNKCVVCGLDKQLTIDHIVPISKGGNSSDENLRTLCKTCNTKKGNKDNDPTPKQNLVDYNPTTDRDQVDNRSMTNRTQIDEVVSCPTDSLIPDSLKLIPDSLIPPPPTTSTEERSQVVVVGDRPLHVFKSALDLYEHYFGFIPNQSILLLLNSYLDEGMKPEAIAFAMREATEGGKPWNYCRSILDRYSKSGVKTLEQAVLDAQTFHQAKEQRGSNINKVVPIRQDKLPASVQRQLEKEKAGVYSAKPQETRTVMDDPELAAMLRDLRERKSSGG